MTEERQAPVEKEEGIPWDGKEITMDERLLAKVEKVLVEINRIFEVHKTSGIPDVLAEMLAHFNLETDEQIAAKNNDFYMWGLDERGLDPQILQKIPALANRKIELPDWLGTSREDRKRQNKIIDDLEKAREDGILYGIYFVLTLGDFLDPNSIRDKHDYLHLLASRGRGDNKVGVGAGRSKRLKFAQEMALACNRCKMWVFGIRQ